MQGQPNHPLLAIVEAADDEPLQPAERLQRLDRMLCHRATAIEAQLQAIATELQEISQVRALIQDSLHAIGVAPVGQAWGK